jgi:hypothetical protein
MLPSRIVRPREGEKPAAEATRHAWLGLLKPRLLVLSNSFETDVDVSLASVDASLNKYVASSPTAKASHPASVGG